MNLTDTLAVGNWLRGRASLAEVEDAPRYGILQNERHSHNAVRLFKLLYIWTAPIYANHPQYRYFKRCGEAALLRRIERAKRLAQRFV